LEEIKMNPAIVPEEFARALYTDIARAVRVQRAKAAAVLIPAYGLREDGTVKDERQVSFLEGFLNLADPVLARRARLPQRLGRPPDRREQSDQGAGSRR
jgi:hypothetical protein